MKQGRRQEPCTKTRSSARDSLTVRIDRRSPAAVLLRLTIRKGQTAKPSLGLFALSPSPGLQSGDWVVLLIETDQIACGVVEGCNPGGAPRGIRMGRFSCFGTESDGIFERCFKVVDPDVRQQARRPRRRSAQHPGAAHVAGRIVEAGAGSIAVADIPGKHCLVESQRLLDVNCGDLDVTPTGTGPGCDLAGVPATMAPQSFGSTSATDWENVQRWPCKSSTLYCLSP